MSEFNFGEYAKDIEQVVNGTEKEKPEPKPEPELKPRKKTTTTRTKTKIVTKVPTMIVIESLLTKYRKKSETTKFLYKRINLKPHSDRATVQKLLDFLRFAQEEGEL